MDWQTFESEMQKLSEKVDFTPDFVVGIVRGGLVPARVLSNLLGVKSMFCLNVDNIEGQRVVNSNINYPLSGKKLLLVEDMLETGKSLIVAKEFLEEKGAEVKTACLYTMPITECSPDAHIKVVDEVIDFPWES